MGGKRDGTEMEMEGMMNEEVSRTQKKEMKRSKV
jgi:hypothetical protein